MENPQTMRMIVKKVDADTPEIRRALPTSPASAHPRAAPTFTIATKLGNTPSRRMGKSVCPVCSARI